MHQYIAYIRLSDGRRTGVELKAENGNEAFELAMQLAWEFTGSSLSVSDVTEKHEHLLSVSVRRVLCDEEVRS